MMCHIDIDQRLDTLCVPVAAETEITTAACAALTAIGMLLIRLPCALISTASTSHQGQLLAAALPHE